MRQIETWLSDSRVSNNVKYPVVYSLVDFFCYVHVFSFCPSCYPSVVCRLQQLSCSQLHRPWLEWLPCLNYLLYPPQPLRQQQGGGGECTNLLVHSPPRCCWGIMFFTCPFVCACVLRARQKIEENCPIAYFNLGLRQCLRLMHVFLLSFWRIFLLVSFRAFCSDVYRPRSVLTKHAWNGNQG